MATTTIKQLHEREGQSVWQDDISRDMLTSGDLQRSIEEIGIRGLTSNPTIFEKAIAGGTAYDEQDGRAAANRARRTRHLRDGGGARISKTPATSSGRSTTAATAATASSRSRFPPAPPATPS